MKALAGAPLTRSPAGYMLPAGAFFGVKMSGNLADLQKAAWALNKSPRGRETMRQLLRFLEDVAIGLDGESQRAVVVFLAAAWSGLPGTVTHTMRQALADQSTKPGDAHA